MLVWLVAPILALVVGSACGTDAPAAPTPNGALAVVPGIEGFGTRTPAGRGGAVLRVTTLADAGPGSLRAAVETPGPRVVIFEVSGTIALSERLDIEQPFVTVAGQTAPSPGVTLRGAPLRIATHDVLVQHLRIRVGDEPGGELPQGQDGLQIYGNDVYNVVADHMSVSWAIDENVSTGLRGSRRDMTIRHSIIAEGLSNSLHPEGEHSKGILVGEGTGQLAIIGNLIAHNRDRNPYGKGHTAVLFVNNVVYNWGTQEASFFAGAGDATAQTASIVGNVYLSGRDTPQGRPIKLADDISPGSAVFVSDNRLDRRRGPADPWQLVENDAGDGVRASAPPVWTTPLSVVNGDDVEAWVLARAGARPAQRDEVDRRMVADAVLGTGRFIDSPSQVGGWPVLLEQVRPLTLPADPNGDRDGDGYTNLEEWLHEFATLVETPQSGVELGSRRSPSGMAYSARLRMNVRAWGR